MFLNNVCLDVTTNSYCDPFVSEETCDEEPADACNWYQAEGEPEARCHLRFQYCGNHGAQECTDTPGCQWLNSLTSGHLAGPEGTSNRGRCLADPCIRINNGRCTIQVRVLLRGPPGSSCISHEFHRTQRKLTDSSIHCSTPEVDACGTRRCV